MRLSLTAAFTCIRRSRIVIEFRPIPVRSSIPGSPPVSEGSPAGAIPVCGWPGWNGRGN